MKRFITVLLATCLTAWAITATAGVLFKEEVNGDYRTCYYRDGTKVTTLTVHVSNPCPVNN